MDALISRFYWNKWNLSICTEHPRFTQFFYAVSGANCWFQGEYIVLKHSSQLFCIGSFKYNVFFCWQFGIDLESSLLFLGLCFPLDGALGGGRFNISSKADPWQAHETAREGQDRHPQAALVNQKRKLRDFLLMVAAENESARQTF